MIPDGTVTLRSVPAAPHRECTDDHFGHSLRAAARRARALAGRFPFAETRRDPYGKAARATRRPSGRRSRRHCIFAHRSGERHWQRERARAGLLRPTAELNAAAALRSGRTASAGCRTGGSATAAPAGGGPLRAARRARPVRARPGSEGSAVRARVPRRRTPMWLIAAGPRCHPATARTAALGRARASRLPARCAALAREAVLGEAFSSSRHHAAYRRDADRVL